MFSFSVRFVYNGIIDIYLWISSCFIYFSRFFNCGEEEEGEGIWGEDVVDIWGVRERLCCLSEWVFDV